jgi:hypothetical protein
MRGVTWLTRTWVQIPETHSETCHGVGVQHTDGVAAKAGREAEQLEKKLRKKIKETIVVSR